MMKEVLRTIAGNPNPSVLRHDLQNSNEPEVILRRAVIGASITGIAAMTAVTFFQSGMVKHLPDPPQQDFDSDSVNSSAEAYSYGTPDGPLSIFSHAATIVLATMGQKRRSQNAPWLAVGASLAAAPAAITALRYLFYQMPVKEKSWCPYCIADALAHAAAFGFTMYESSKAIKRLLPKASVAKRRLH